MTEAMAYHRSLHVLPVSARSAWRAAGAVALIAVTVPLSRWITQPATPVRRAAIVEGRLTGDEDSVRQLERFNAKLPAASQRSDIHQLAIVHLRGGRTAAAAALLQKASRLEPNDLAVATDLGVAEMALGQLADAAERFGS